MNLPASTATTESGVLRDLAYHMASRYQSDDLIPRGTGVNKPFGREINTADDLVGEVFSWFDAQNTRQGGRSMDTPRTPAGDLYADRRYSLLRSEEGVREWAYDDATGSRIAPGAQPRGNVTVGIGFNMARSDALEVWGRVFGDNGPNFDAIREGRDRLSEVQIRRLFDHTAEEAEAVVNNKFLGVVMPEHQRLALVSMAFNGPALIGPNITAAVREGRQDEAARLIEGASATRQPVLNGRRRREASLFRGASV